MKNISVIALMLFVITTYSQITLIPDSNFEQYLINLGIDSDGVINGQVLTSDIDGIINFSFAGNPEITDITGIEDFASLEFLSIFSVNITEINLAENLNLKRLDIEDVSLISLDISNNIALEEFHLALNYSGGIFTSPINNLNLSSNTLLDHLTISRSNISFLGLSNNSNITFLRLNLMEDLTDINLKSGNNEQLTFLRIQNNINLECVQVDDPLAVMAGTDPPYNNWIIENNPIITDDCNLGFEHYLASQIRVYPNPVSEQLFIASENTQIENIRVYSISGKQLMEVSKVEDSVDVSSLSEGLYFIELNTLEGKSVQKFIKQ